MGILQRFLWAHAPLLCGIGCSSVLAATAPLEWATRRIGMDAAYAAQVVGGNGIYLIASSHGGIPAFAWSPDGLSWQPGTVPVSRSGAYEYVAGAAFAGDNWVAVGAAGLVLISADNAQTWERAPRVSNGAANFNGVIAADGVLLGFGKEWKPDPGGEGGGGEVAGVLISEDGGWSWESLDADSTVELFCGAALDGIWVVAGQAGTILRSADFGATWQPVVSNATGNLRAAAAGNGRFVLVGPNGQVLVSSDGALTWHEVFAPGEFWVEGVAFGDGRFVLSGGNAQTAGAISVDGWNWVAAGRLGAWGSLGYGPNGFLAVAGTHGWQTTVPNPPIVLPEQEPLRSSTSLGRTLPLALRGSQHPATFAIDGPPPGVELNPATGRFAGGATYPGTYLSFLYAVRDGGAGDVRAAVFEVRDESSPPGEALVWNKLTSGLPETFYVQGVGFGGGVFAAVAEDPDGAPLVARSANGRNWQLAQPPPGTPTQGAWGMVRCVAFGNGVWLASGRNGNLWRSTDQAHTWQQQPQIPDAQEINAIAGDGALFVAVGKAQRPDPGGEGAGGFVSNDAGATWRDAELWQHPPLRAVTNAGGVWIAVGERGVILRSADAANTWQEVESGTFHTLRGISGWGHFFVAAGEGGTVLCSRDGGLTWSSAYAGATHWLLGVANASGLFALSGGDEAAGASSRDGLQWSPPASGAAYGAIVSDGESLFALNGGEVWFARGPWRPAVFAPGSVPPGKLGEMFELSLDATGSPVRYHATGLPRGLSIDPATGEISGIPLVPRSFRVQVSASNLAGRGPVTTLLIDIENPFPPAAGNYFGLVEPNPAINDGLGGCLNLSVSHLGAFSGRLENGMAVYPVRGNLDANGRATVNLEQPSLPAVQLELEIELEGEDAGAFAARLVAGADVAEIAGWRIVWHARSNPATAWAGQYNAGAEAVAVEPLTELGWGFASLVVRATGTVRIAGRLPDRQTLSTTVPLSPDGAIPLFLRLRPTGAALSGQIEIDAGDGGLAGVWRWAQPEAAFRDWLHPGFDARLEIFGALYLAPARGQRVIGLSDGEDNAVFESYSTGAVPLTVSPQNRAAWERDGRLLSLAITPNTGALRGAVSGQPVRARVPFQGLLIESDQQAGFGFLLLPTGPAGGAVSEKIWFGPNPD